MGASSTGQINTQREIAGFCGRAGRQARHFIVYCQCNNITLLFCFQHLMLLFTDKATYVAKTQQSLLTLK
jgi:hypothetical protein